MEETRKETSRTPIIDIVENIAELIAMQSHLSELYTSTINEMEENVKEEDMNDETSMWYIAEKEEELKRFKTMYEDAYRNRKKLMTILKERYNCNMDYWCLVKHSIASRQFSKELWDTDRDNLDYESLYIKSSEVMYSILSSFLWVKIVKCWRCLLDATKE